MAIYSSNYGSLDPRHYPEDAEFRSYIGNEYMGHKWQCVEFARRFLFLNHGFVFTDVGMAWEIFSLRFAPVVNDNILPLQAFANGSKRAPQVVRCSSGKRAVSFMRPATSPSLPSCWMTGTDCRAERYSLPLPMGQQWTRELRLSVEDGCYTLHDTFNDTGSSAG